MDDGRRSIDRWWHCESVKARHPHAHARTALWWSNSSSTHTHKARRPHTHGWTSFIDFLSGFGTESKVTRELNYNVQFTIEIPGLDFSESRYYLFIRQQPYETTLHFCQCSTLLAYDKRNMEDGRTYSGSCSSRLPACLTVYGGQGNNTSVQPELAVTCRLWPCVARTDSQPNTRHKLRLSTCGHFEILNDVAWVE